MSVGLTDNLRPLRAEAHLVSTFRLEPEHFHLTTGTFNLIVKDRIASRLSGAPSVRTSSRHRRESVRPRNLSKLSRRRKRCQPAEATGFPPVFHKQRGVRSIAWRTLATRDETLPLPSLVFSAQAEAEDSELIKDRLEVLLFAKPFRDLVPECGPRDPGPNGGLLNWMPRAAATMRKQALTRSHCPRLWCLYQNGQSCARGNQEKHLNGTATEVKTRRIAEVRLQRLQP
jgi:hypothetical protein